MVARVENISFDAKIRAGRVKTFLALGDFEMDESTISDPVKQEDYFAVGDRLAELGVTASSGIVVLPENLKDVEAKTDFVYSSSSTDLLKLFRLNNIEASSPSAQPLTERRNHDYTLYLPILFYSAAYLAENPQAMSVTLGVISNYATEFLKGYAGGGKVDISFAIETHKTKTKSVKKYSYSGPPKQLSTLLKFVESQDE